MSDVLKLVEEQAEDEGLWFQAKTAPEAYLQQELRKLHAAIESHYGEPAVKAEHLAIVLQRKHFPEVVNFKPMANDLMGLLLQIDNMTSGLSRTDPET